MVADPGALITAFLVGLVGGVHCLGMCGGVVTTLSLPGRQPARRRLLFQAAYNLGRISSYVFAGALMGALGLMLVDQFAIATARKVLLIFAGLFMVLLGGYLAGWWKLLDRVEAGGRQLWRHIEPRARTLLPPRNAAQAVQLGMLWGWLPCGLVYSMLIQAMGTGSALGGAAVMAAFALGTLPNLLLFGTLAGAAAQLIRSRRAKQLAGVLVTGFGLHALWRAF